MRRKDREVTDIEKLIGIVEMCKVCRIGINDEEYPYIVPMNFGYSFENEKLTLYFHCAKEGKKLDLLRKNPKVFIEMDCDHFLYAHDEEVPCTYSYRFLSIMGKGEAKILEADSDKEKALKHIMMHMTGREFAFNKMMLDMVTVFRIEISEFTGKEHE